MVYILTMLMAEQFAGALLFFPVVWIFMRKRRGQKLHVSTYWLLAGLLATIFGAGVLRFLCIFFIGEEATLSPEGGLQLFFYLGLPTLVAIGVCSFLRTKTTPATTQESA